jgi:hypothetical protein
MDAQYSTLTSCHHDECDYVDEDKNIVIVNKYSNIILEFVKSTSQKCKKCYF